MAKDADSQIIEENKTLKMCSLNCTNLLVFKAAAFHLHMYHILIMLKVT
jgi:hypothetical protein